MILESEPQVVYPQLLRTAALEMLGGIKNAAPQQLRLRASTSHPAAEFYPTGNRVSEDRLEAIAAAVRAQADNLGFPQPPGTTRQGQFDRAMPLLLYRQMHIVPANAACEGVWSFLALVLLPDVAVWRFPQRAEERLIGRPRNVFRRYWWRARSLGVNPGDPTSELGEDQLVQVMERPSISGSRKLARTFAQTVLQTAADSPDVPIEPLMRDAAKRLVRLTPFVCLEALPDGVLRSQLGELVATSARALRARRAQESA